MLKQLPLRLAAWRLPNSQPGTAALPRLGFKGSLRAKNSGKSHPGPTAIELRNSPTSNLLPFPARDERGEGWGEGNRQQKRASSPPSDGGEGEISTLSALAFLNSTAVHPGPLPQGEGELFPALENVHRLVTFPGATFGGSLSWEVRVGASLVSDCMVTAKLRLTVVICILSSLRSFSHEHAR